MVAAMTQDESALVQGLYDSRENFKKDSLQKEVDEVLKKIRHPEDVSDSKDKAFLYYLRGRAMDVFSDFNAEAEQNLSRAVKLDPTLIQAWNCLGNCFWKQPDHSAAKNCFLGALKKEKNKVSLRSLSMLLRVMEDTKETDNIEESMTMAKEALSMDFKDAESWYILGNASLAYFFRKSFDYKDLDKAIKAYAQSETLQESSKKNPDLFFNRGIVYKYQEKYDEAIDQFKKARDLDPGLPVDYEIDAILEKERKITNQIEQKGHLKKKKLTSICSELEALEKSATKQGYEAASVALLLAQLASEKCVIHMRIVDIATPKGMAPTTAVCVDRDGTFAAVSCYNLDVSAVKPGANISIGDPTASLFTAQESKIEYPLIQVTNPEAVLIDMKPVFASKVVVPAKLATKTFTETR